MIALLVILIWNCSYCSYYTISNNVTIRSPKILFIDYILELSINLRKLTRIKRIDVMYKRWNKQNKFRLKPQPHQERNQMQH